MSQPTGIMNQMRAVTPSYLDRVRVELAEIADELQSLLDRSTIRNVDPNTDDSPLVFIGAADWGWGPSDADMTAVQMRLGSRYQSWFDRFTLLFPHPTPDVATKILEGDEFVRRWISRPDAWDHSIPRTIDLAKSRADTELAVFDVLLEIAARSSTDALRLVPDTNALIRNPDLASYARAAPSPTFIVHLLPTVLSELDNLKDQGVAGAPRSGTSRRAQAQGAA